MLDLAHPPPDVLTGRQQLPPRRPVLEEADLSRRRPFKRVQELPTHNRKAVLKTIDAMADVVRRKAS